MKGGLLALAMILLAMEGRPAWALPTMIRLGYTNCAACHIAPQGGGPLNLYGRSIDQAQSLRGGEYQSWQSPWSQAINWGGRITQDLRLVMQQQDTSVTGRDSSQLFRSRLFYRNATELGHGLRISATISGENLAAPRPTLAYEPPNTSSTVFVNTALLSYRAAKALEFSAGRDLLPTGLNIADLGVWIRSRNRQGYYDAPTQFKAFWWGKRYLISPYGFGPGGNEPSGLRESGGGALAEFDVLGNHRTVAGMNMLHASARNSNRTLIGPYVRLGFGKWGILGEHDITQRSLFTASPVAFRQSASYGQLFWAAREWLVPSLIVERLRVQAPYRESLNALKLELSARLSSQVTLSAGPRIQRDELTGRVTKSIVFQVAVKTVH